MSSYKGTGFNNGEKSAPFEAKISAKPTQDDVRRREARRSIENMGDDRRLKDELDFL